MVGLEVFKQVRRVATSLYSFSTEGARWFCLTTLVVRIGPDSISLSLTHNLSVLDLNDHMHMSRAVLVT